MFSFTSFSLIGIHAFGNVYQTRFVLDSSNLTHSISYRCALKALFPVVVALSRGKENILSFESVCRA